MRGKAQRSCAVGATWRIRLNVQATCCLRRLSNSSREDRRNDCQVQIQQQHKKTVKTPISSTFSLFETECLHFIRQKVLFPTISVVKSPATTNQIIALIHLNSHSKCIMNGHSYNADRVCQQEILTYLFCESPRICGLVDPRFGYKRAETSVRSQSDGGSRPMHVVDDCRRAFAHFQS